MAEAELERRARGDEGELFREFHPILVRIVAQSIRGAGSETVEDACSFAWAQFMEHQPDRDRNWKSWLITTAKRQAWLIEDQAHAQLADEHFELRVDVNRLAPLSLQEQREIRDDVAEALSIIVALPPRLQRVAMLRALGVRHAEIGQLTGDSPRRVAMLVDRANAQIYELLAERGHVPQSESPRVARLKELEADPPGRLVEHIGRPVGRSRKCGGRAIRQRAWRRAAIALDDYRAAAELVDPFDLTEQSPTDPALRTLLSVAVRAVEAHYEARFHERDTARQR
jgi:DNA-directed RNA polymerase specialized sigma24 family protein